MTNDQERQLRVMAFKLDAFAKGELALSALIPELEGLFNAVNLDDQHWREGFWDSWGELEINYAFALDMGWKALDQTSEQLVVEAVTDLKSLIETKLQEV
jgi:hypothetical protein